MAAAVVLSSITLDKPKELEFKFWLRLSEKWLRHLRRTRVVAAAVLCDNKAYPSLDFRLRLGLGCGKKC